MPRASAKTKSTERKIFVLDTSAILFDHNAFFNFKEHDVAIPITVLEEIDRFKKGNDVINFEAREFIRSIDKLSASFSLQDWIPPFCDTRSPPFSEPPRHALIQR